MKLSFSLLQKYISFKESDTQKIVDAITEKTAEVDDVHVQGAFLKDCCVGKILTIAKHPNADRLSVCTIQTDRGVKPVVCGGTNLHEGMTVAFAHTGATVQSETGETFTLKSVKIRGEASEGMICAAHELDIAHLYPVALADGDRPVVHLRAEDAAVGMLLQEYLQLNDTVLTIDNHAITNRSDLFSHLGFARELVAMGLAVWKQDPQFAEPTWGKDVLPFQITIDSPEYMPRYMGCMVQVDSLGTTPDWMKQILASVGIRSISLPVDITNYVLLETGLPLHCFDVADIVGNVHMRTATESDTMETLDGKSRTVAAGALILEDDAGIFDLVGIMGGLRTSTKQSSRTLYVHAASLDPVLIRKAMIAMGHRTDAGTVYEKGVTPYIVEQGFYRVIQLFLELIPGAKVTSQLHTVGTTPVYPAITISHSHIEKYIGHTIAADFIVSTLQALGFTCTDDQAVYTVIPPLWRKDCVRREDIIEEIARMYGFNVIPATMPSASTIPPTRETRVHTFRNTLQALQYNELIPLSLLGPQLLRQTGLPVENAVQIVDPIGEELSLMQPSVLPRLLEHAAAHLRPKQQHFATWNIARVFAQNTPEYTQCGMLFAHSKVVNVLDDPFFVLKSHCIAASQAADTALQIQPYIGEVPVYAHPGRSAGICVHGKQIGILCTIHPRVLHAFGIQAIVAVALFSVDDWLQSPAAVRIATTVPSFPAIEYDETFTVANTVSIEAMLLSAKNSHTLLESIELIDVYAKQLPATEYAVTVHCVYRAGDKTLTEAEAKAAHDIVLRTLRT